MRGLFRRGNSNIIKVLCLAAGLALGLLLVAKVCYERSYNDFIADAERIYVIEETFDRGGDQGSYTFPRVSGGVLPAMVEGIAQIETGARLVDFGYSALISAKNDTLNLRSFLADSTLMQTLSLPMKAGNPLKAFENPYSVMINESTAKMLGGIEETMGQSLRLAEGEATLTVTGVFEDLPDNTHLSFEALISIVHMSEWSLNNWGGNERYESYIKAVPGAEADKLEGEMLKVQANHMDMDEVDRNGHLRYSLKPLLDIHVADPEVKASTNFMLTLGIMLISMTIFNYMLLVISTMASRTRATAIEKCYGAGTSEIAKRTFAEVATHLTLALALAAALIWIFKGTAMRLLEVNLASLMAPATIGVLIGVVILVLVLSVFGPSVLYSRVPVAVAFRGSISTNRWWKLALLFMQFVGVTFLAVTMAYMAKQYNYLFHADAGYSYENLAYANVGTDYSHRQAVEQEVKKVPGVENVTFCFQTIWTGSSGNNVKLSGSGDEVLNYADLYTITDNYFDVLEIPIIAGEVFTPGELNENKIMVSRSFAEKVGNAAGWRDGAVGKRVILTEHSNTGDDYFEIVGVYEDFRIGSMDRCEYRPSVVFYDLNGNGYLRPYNMLVKLKDIDTETLKQVEQAVGDKVQTLHQVMERQFEKDKNMRDSLMICCAVALVIALAGLVGYSIDEINRRKREIAIRKVNGAESTDVVRVICKDVAILSAPAIAIGAAMGYITGMRWLENFTRTSPLSIWEILGIGAALFLIIVGCVAFRAAKAANVNPTEIINSSL
ncbi:MAG: ABC transporter permease [Clostridium sp.]|nr:ABC transporter permease [Clostridium sp.]